MKFTKKPVSIEARQFTNNNEPGNVQMNELVAWIGGGAYHNGTDIFIPTLEGEMRAVHGDWIIRGVKGEFYPCKPDIFEATYHPGDAAAPQTCPATTEPTEDQVRNHPLCLELRDLKDGAYTERNRVVAAFARMAQEHGWPVAILKTDIDGWDPEWRNCIFIGTPFGQVSWHFHDKERDLFPNTMAGPGAIWDGHTTDEKYRRLGELVGTFSIPRGIGWAVNRMRAGEKVRRAGWNGKGMYLWLLPETKVPADWCKEPHLRALAENNPDGSKTMHCLPSIRMKTADGKVLTGWLASQTDLLANDWETADLEVVG